MTTKRNKNNDGGDSDSDEDAALFNQLPPAEPVKEETKQIEIKPEPEEISVSVEKEISPQPLVVPQPD